MQLFLTSADVCEITGITPRMLHGWCEQGYVRPNEGGDGTGNFRKYSLMQTLGIHIAYQLRQSDRSCALSYAALVINAFAEMSEEQLLEQFRKRRTHLVGVFGGTTHLSRPQYSEWIDVQEAYYHTVRMAKAIENRLYHDTGGRTRGLAGAILKKQD